MSIIRHLPVLAGPGGRDKVRRGVREKYEQVDDTVAQHARGSESGKGDCTEHAALLVALCRAAGLPARNVSGMEYLVSKRDGPCIGFHAWAEVYVGKWIGVDATIPEVGTSARYLYFGYFEPNDDAGAVKIVQALGGMKFDVLNYRFKNGERVVLKQASAPTGESSRE